MMKKIMAFKFCPECGFKLYEATEKATELMALMSNWIHLIEHAKYKF